MWANSQLWQLWCYCLLRANHEDNWVNIKTGRGETEVLVKAGQFLFGRNTAGRALKQKPISVYRRLKKLSRMGNLNLKPNTHYTTVSICNWNTYQSLKSFHGQASELPSNTQVTTNEHPSNTQVTQTRMIKNDKNVSNSIVFSFQSGFSGITDKDKIRWSEAYPTVDIDLAIRQAAEWLRSNPTKLKSNYRRFLTNWLKRDQEKGGNKQYGSNKAQTSGRGPDEIHIR